MTCGSIYAQQIGWQSGVRSCFMSGLTTDLVQELNDGTVDERGERKASDHTATLAGKVYVHVHYEFI